MTEELREFERHNKAPRAFLVFFFALIAWGVYYIARYTPEISGWSQYRVLEKETADARKAAPAGAMRENPYEMDPKAIVEGRVIFGENCSGCHGKDLKGGVGPDLTAHLKYGESDDKKYETIAGGRPNGMPSFEAQLGRERIWKVLAYVDSVRERGAKP
ncbi:MAG: c-type cytochrome [Deltaproteobacteria bacterium]|nr:c-type cytochrome [Deltaproteobacteria bacterium]